jgi:hypothetical protein
MGRLLPTISFSGVFKMSDQIRTTSRLQTSVLSHWCAIVLAASLSVLASCSRKLERPAPPTFPVKGKVVTNGGPLPVGGCVEFEPNRNGLEITATGVIDSEGRFSLSIPFVDRVLPGATEGSHSVRVLLPIDDGGGVVRIREPFIVQPRENEFTINIPKRS